VWIGLLALALAIGFAWFAVRWLTRPPGQHRA
jgi:HAMP domain-containing protein